MERLTHREKQIAELVAWGAAAKEVPDLLKAKYGGHEISVITVRNVLAKVYEKLHINKANELSAWWFCHFCGVNSELSPLKDIKRTLLSIVFLIIITPQILSVDLDQAVRPSRTRTRTRTENVVKGRRKDGA